jgi:hypothetical protein
LTRFVNSDRQSKSHKPGSLRPGRARRSTLLATGFQVPTLPTHETMLQPGGEKRGEVKKAHARGRYGRNTQDSLYKKLSDDTSTTSAVAEEMDRRSSGPASEDEVMQFYIEDVARNVAELALTRVFAKWPLCCCKCVMADVIESLEIEIGNLSHGTSGSSKLGGFCFWPPF